MARPRRVLHVISTPSGTGGAEHVLRQLAASSAGRGEDVRVLNPFAASLANAEAAEAFYAPAQVAARVTRRPTDLPAAARWAARQVRDAAPDVVHVHLFHACGLVAALPRGREVRLLTQHHGSLLAWRGQRARARLDVWATRRMDHVVAVSEAVRRHVLDTTGLADARVSVIRNGWTGRPRPHEGSLYGATVVCVANFRQEKGHEVLLEAFAEVRRRVPAARLVLVGDGARRAELVALAQQQGLDAAVEWTGAVQDVWPVLARADVFALAAWQEPLGIAALEAMAAGLPVVATAVGGLPEVVPEAAGTLVPAGDVEAMATALTALLTDPARRRAAGRAGLAQATLTSSAAMVEAYADRYDRLVATAPRERG